MQNSSPPKHKTQKLIGTIERLTFHNQENGYTVAKLVPRGKKYEVAVVGTMPELKVGESVQLEGLWITHSQYGRQFEVHRYTVKLPASVEGIRKYLGSGLVKGVGPVMAAGIVDRFGLETLDVIEKTPHRLREVPGIGEKRTYRITCAWEEQKHIKEIMLFLQSHNVSTGLAVKIYKQYGNDAIAVVRKDPYRLAKDIFGVGFKTADKIARQIGLAPDAPERIQAGLLYAMSRLSDEGHCYATLEQLVSEATTLLEVPHQACTEELTALITQEDLISEDGSIYLPPFYYAEVGTANRIRRIQSTPSDRLEIFQRIDWSKAFDWMDSDSSIKLTSQQKSAIQMSLCEKISILTGGPGTGKSTITKNLIHLLKARRGTVLLAAPTGRAAKRLGEATGLEAKTIHRLLEFSPGKRNPFRRNEENPLDADLVIIDETSMVDILLMNRLLSAIGTGTHLLLVGDVDQLPSVGPGNVLGDLIASTVIPVTRLETIFRQAHDSFIIVNAHRINRGEYPTFSKSSRDFFFFKEEDAGKAADWVLDVVTKRIPGKFGYDPMKDIQVLSPMHRGDAGVGELNRRLQETL
ncbi:MAG: ATP-dependent RecD-like DNA helicase, partial [Anaerolineaceae bacterium]|nr:ATP-dependent RecD-like DNA helicase [Anaerolineaceae bacterium]